MGDAGTLLELVKDIDTVTAVKVMEWATGRATLKTRPAFRRGG